MPKIIIAIILIVFATGLSFWFNQSISTPEGSFNIPQECQQFQESDCDLFNCMVESCWCSDMVRPNPIYEGTKSVLNEQEAISAVKQYLQSINSDYDEVKSATKINSFFFNVFAYNAENEEEVFTIGINGTILLAICGV